MAKHKNKVIRLTVSSQVQSIEHAISDQCYELSLSLTRKIIDVGGVHLNGRRVRKCSLSVADGDKVEIFIDGFDLNPYRLSDNDIIYQDDYIIAINKPTQIDSQPTPARYKGTLYEALLLRLQDPFRLHLKPTLGMVQRLDRDTTGVMIFSIHQRAHKALTELFAQRLAKKKYLALVCGQLADDEGEFTSTLAKNRATNKMKTVEKGGKLAITRYSTLHQFEKFTLVKVDIPTGRTHQIRVHFSEAGHPLVGDDRYGYDVSMLDVAVARTMLHSWALECDHPVTKKKMNFKASPPHDFMQLLTLLGWQDHVDLSSH
ncbi:MAG: hypothetical protein BA874_02725 [Desulfuromonadales bacterium C00003068]|nr:MAG: hypothetical protein BA874_02725 [Desulfuromonadales bacterium C00003068]